MGNQTAESWGGEERGHEFKKIEGILRCAHCGQTADNFYAFQKHCAVPQLYRDEEPASEDMYAVVCWDSGTRTFWHDVREAEAFRDAQDKRFLWLGPIPLVSIDPKPGRQPSQTSFEQYLRTRSQLRDANTVSLSEALADTMTDLKLPLTSLIDCCLREDHLWAELEEASLREPGHFIADLAVPEPTQVLSQVACDIERIAVAQGYGRCDLARLFRSVNLHRHIASFAGGSLAFRVPDDVVDRGLHWVLVNCHFYARDLSAGIEDDGRDDSVVGPDKMLLPNKYGASSWNEVEIVFMTDYTVQIKTPAAVSEPLGYKEFGFGNARNGNPKEAWETLRNMAENKGFIQANFTGRKREKVEKRVQELRKVFRRMFGITSDPLQFTPRDGYQAQFRISCAPSYQGSTPLNPFETL